MLPTGNLRESRIGAKRANMIIVTKCPPNISELAQENIKQKIGLDTPVFFTFVDYDDQVYNENGSLTVNEIKAQEKLLLAGIAKPKPFFDYLQSGKDRVMTFADHHHYNESDILDIKNQAKDKNIVTTEKDFVRLQASNLAMALYYLPIKSRLINNSNTFDQIILDYVGTCTRNR
jgi:tetraacyldisaccharide 4'-kinase